MKRSSVALSRLGECEISNVGKSWQEDNSNTNMPCPHCELHTHTCFSLPACSEASRNERLFGGEAGAAAAWLELGGPPVDATAGVAAGRPAVSNAVGGAACEKAGCWGAE